MGRKGSCITSPGGASSTKEDIQSRLCAIAELGVQRRFQVVGMRERGEIGRDDAGNLKKP